MAQAEKRRPLGRGLSALIPAKPTDTGGAGGVRKLPIDEVLPSDAQPRQVFEEEALAELAGSIEIHGLLQPIVVRTRAPHQYEIVAGERRWRAAQRAGLEEIEAIISDVAEEDTLTLALVENLQRQDLNPIEEAEAFQRLHKELGYSQAEIAQAVGKNRTTVANLMRLLKLPRPVQQQVLDGRLSMGHARALLSATAEDRILTLAKRAEQQGWSVRQTEAQAKKSPAAPTIQRRTAAPKESEAAKDVRLRLQRALGTKVELRVGSSGSGTFTVHFGGYEELDALLDRIGA